MKKNIKKERLKDIFQLTPNQKKELKKIRNEVHSGKTKLINYKAK